MRKYAYLAVILILALFLVAPIVWSKGDVVGLKARVTSGDYSWLLRITFPAGTTLSGGNATLPTSYAGNETQINRLIDADHADNATTDAETSDNQSVTPASMAYWSRNALVTTLQAWLSGGTITDISVAGLGTFGTLSAGAGGFSVGATGAVTGQSFSPLRVSGQPSVTEIYEDPDYGDNKSRVTAAPGRGFSAMRHFYIPDNNGTALISCSSTHDFDNGTDNWTLTASESICPHISVSNANGAIIAKITTPIPGHNYTVENGSGQTLTFKVAEQTGGTIANGKWAFYTTTATDVVEVYELP